MTIQILEKKKEMAIDLLLIFLSNIGIKHTLELRLTAFKTKLQKRGVYVINYGKFQNHYHYYYIDYKAFC